MLLLYMKILCMLKKGIEELIEVFNPITCNKFSNFSLPESDIWNTLTYKDRLDQDISIIEKPINVSIKKIRCNVIKNEKTD